MPALLLLLAACGSSEPHAASAVAGAVDTTVLGALRVRAADTLLTLSDRRAKATVSLIGYLNSSGGYSHALLDARQGATGARYLLLRTRGKSRLDQPDGQCGAGEETNLVWLAVDPALRVAKAQSVLVASCLQMREPVGKNDEMAGEPWSIAFYIPGDSVRTATYDRRAPERGIRETTAPAR